MQKPLQGGRLTMAFQGHCTVWWVVLSKVCSFRKFSCCLVRCLNTSQHLCLFRVGCSRVLSAEVCAPLQALNSLLRWSPSDGYNSFFWKEDVIKCKPFNVNSSMLILISAAIKCYSAFACRMVSAQSTLPAVQVLCILIHSLTYVCYARYDFLRIGLPFRRTPTGYSNGLNKISRVPEITSAKACTWNRLTSPWGQARDRLAGKLICLRKT